MTTIKLKELRSVERILKELLINGYTVTVKPVINENKKYYNLTIYNSDINPNNTTEEEYEDIDSKYKSTGSINPSTYKYTVTTTNTTTNSDSMNSINNRLGLMI